MRQVTAYQTSDGRLFDCYWDAAFHENEVAVESDISVLNLSVRTRNCLKAEGVTTVARLLMYDRKTIATKIPNLGKISAMELDSELSNLRLVFKNA